MKDDVFASQNIFGRRVHVNSYTHKSVDMCVVT